MAIIRSRRLFTVNVPAAAEVQALDEEINPLAWTPVYTCPSGFRAIMRTLTLVLNWQPPPGEESTASVQLVPPGLQIHWNWFLHHYSPETAVWDFEDTWNAMVVLHGGDRLEVANNSTVLLSCHGSGHLLPEQS